MKLERLWTLVLSFLVVWSPGTVSFADPCGMVPPIWLGDGMPIVRVGEQRTYVFYKDGIESFVIRPGFSGQVDEFGMLIPFPSPPAIRKVADGVFAHVAAAVSPPEVVVDLRPNRFACMAELGYVSEEGAREDSDALGVLARKSVRVIRQEAVGMYEVAVLEAGSAEALKRWMDGHGFRYPEGMDVTCEEYVEEGWCFVAVKARVGQKSLSEPRPGMRTVDPSMPAGSTFDGHVQAMGFRFRTDELVLPMRLSTFNEGDLHNVVYVLTDGPREIRNVPQEHVVRQVSGWELYANLTEPLPLRILGGNLESLDANRLADLERRRDPLPHMGIARELFASDLLAVQTGQLAHPHEEREKSLLEIGERLGLRGPELDALHDQALRAERELVVQSALAGLRDMTLTVVDGDFPRDVLARENLTFAPYTMPFEKNEARLYDARHGGPAPVLGGFTGGGGSTLPPAAGVALFFAAGLLVGALLLSRRRLRTVGVSAVALGLCLGLTSFSAPLLSLDDPLEELVALGDRAVPGLVSQASQGDSTVEQGWAIVALSEIGGTQAREGIGKIAATTDSALVRTWALAAQIRTSTAPEELLKLVSFVQSNRALVRPYRQRWLDFASSPEGLPSAVLLSAASSLPELQPDLLPILIDRGTETLVPLMLHADQQLDRRLAAGCLATVATQFARRDEVSLATIEALAFDPSAVDVPWSGGPLFIPSIAWQEGDSRVLVRELLSWMVWCDLREREDERTQIHNNLRGVGLARVAGYESPGWNLVETARWLQIWGKARGFDDVEDLLREQGASRIPRLRIALER